MNIDGVPARKVVRPQSIEEISTIIAQEKGSIVPMGAATQMHFGNPLKSADCVVDLAGLNRITTYNPAELTIHVEAGATLGHIQSALGANNQTLPLDPWNGPGATIGGIAAANAQGPLRATGTIRDWIIGMKVIHADGRSSKTGGRVVKNVTGYDLAKLYTGSLGTLAVIAEISLKVRPQFGKTATAIARCERVADALEIVAAVRKSPLHPISCELVGPDHAVWLRFGEHPRAVDWQLAHLPPVDWSILEGEEEIAAWAKLQGLFEKMGPVVLRVVGSAAAVGGIQQSHQPTAWIAHALNGIVLMALPGDDAISRVREQFPAVIEKASIETRQRFGVFGVTGIEKQLIQQMKQTFDSEGRLNPGRHVDGE